MIVRYADQSEAFEDHARRDLPHIPNSLPGTTWGVCSDQVLHTAMGGRHLMEQTLYPDSAGLQQPDSSPLHTLERQLGRSLR